VGEIDQARGRFLGSEPLLEAFRTAVPELDTAAVRTLLAKFGLTADHVLRPAGTLSPGERTRAALALLQARGVNLLVLDEPTNHLDLPAIEQLEAALDSYTGTLLWSRTTGGPLRRSAPRGGCTSRRAGSRS
jgi:ATPase subunit of ABC transporter with duplicated ATPase domains